MFNPATALLFLRTRIALGCKAPTCLSRKTINVFLLKANFDHDVFKKVSPNDCDNDR